MYKFDISNEKLWNLEKGQDFDDTKQKILLILKEQKVSFAQVRGLFHSILNEIDYDNPITL